MSIFKSVQENRHADPAQRQQGEPDIEQKPLIEQTPLKLRNPALARPFESGGRPLGAEESAPAGRETHAANGYWLHDAAGPRAYVSPEANTAAAPGLAAAEVVALIEECLGYLDRLDASRIHVSVTGDDLTLRGQVESAEARRRAGTCAVTAARGRRVINRLIVDK